MTKTTIFFFIFLQTACYSHDYQSSFLEHAQASGKEISAVSTVFFKTPLKEGPHDPSKPAVLLVHGLSASPKHWHLAIPKLETAGFDVYFVRLHYGKPDGFAKGVAEIERMAKEIFKDHEVVHLIGHSLGGVAVIEAGYALQQEGYPIKKVVTINSPLRGTKMMNSATKIAFPTHLIEVLEPDALFLKALSKKGKTLWMNNTEIFHIAVETDHLVPGVDCCFLPHCKEKLILKGCGHLSTLNERYVHEKLVTWLK